MFGRLHVSVCKVIMLFLLLIAGLTGCTNLRPVSMDAERLQEDIRHGGVIQEGDTVRIITRDGVSRQIVVTAVEENTIRGNAYGARTGAIEIEVPVDDIVMLEKEKVDALNTAAGSIGTMAIVISIISILWLISL
jgi:hypothetical protein